MLGLVTMGTAQNCQVSTTAIALDNHVAVEPLEKVWCLHGYIFMHSPWIPSPWLLTGAYCVQCRGVEKLWDEEHHWQELMCGASLWTCGCLLHHTHSILREKRGTTRGKKGLGHYYYTLNY
jgi:hypothetical protein